MCDLTRRDVIMALAAIPNVEGKNRLVGRFAGVDFTGLDLSSLSFSNLELSGAKFRGCNLTGCRFVNSFGYAVDFTGANMAGAVLDDATFDDAIFTRANLRGCYANGLQAESADFTGADLTGAMVQSAALRFVKFRAAKLVNVCFDGSCFHGNDWLLATIADCSWVNVRGAGGAPPPLPPGVKVGDVSVAQVRRQDELRRKMGRLDAVA